MNKKVILLILLSIAFLVFILTSFCFFSGVLFSINSKPTVIEQREESKLILLEKNQTITISIDPEINIKLIDIKDSRCLGGNIICSWEGELSYTVLINGIQKEISTVLNRYIEYDRYIFNINSEKSTTNRLAVVVQEEKKIGELITLKEKQAAIVNDEFKLKIILNGIKDSRCKGEETCFWEGELVYSISINNEQKELSTALNKKLKYNNYIFSIVNEKCTENELTIIVQKDDNVDQEKKEILINESFKLEKNEVAVLNEDSKLEIKLVEIIDSRCKMGEKCTSKSELSYSLLVNDKKIQLGTKNNKQIEYDNYVINIIKEKCTENELILKINNKEW